MPHVSVDTEVLPEQEVVERTDFKLLPPYNVIIANDDHHSMEFVVAVLFKVLGCTIERAVVLMEEAHTSGRAIIWTGSKEVAELKRDQVLTFHEKREDGRDLGPVGCTIEPAPGA
jgi:ATP-dependent Clp protease adaptor protein ClpS